MTAQKGTGGSPDAVSRSLFAYDTLSRVTSEAQSIAAGTVRTVTYGYSKGGQRTTMIHHAGAATAGYAYDSRDRCTQVTKDGGTLADYTWNGGALARRDTTCDYPGGTKPKFKSDFQRDGLLRVTKLVNEHLTLDQAGSTYGDLGTWDYAYDTAGNALSAIQATTLGLNLRVDNWYGYDTANRLITSQYDDHLSGWNISSTVTSSYQYDDLGNRQSHD